MTSIIGNFIAMMRHILDDVFNKALNKGLSNLLTERRLAHLIRLGHGKLKFQKSPKNPNTLCGFIKGFYLRNRLKSFLNFNQRVIFASYAAFVIELYKKKKKYCF